MGQIFQSGIGVSAVVAARRPSRSADTVLVLILDCFLARIKNSSFIVGITRS